MPALTWLTHHRLWILGLGLTTVLVVVAAGVWFFLIRSPGTQVDLRQALRLYRQGQESGRVDPVDARLPPPGVYRYRTTGGEQLSLGGISRSFPATTEMVVTDSGCATMMWYPLEQHTEGLVVCSSSTGALVTTSALSKEQIAGVRTADTFRCATGALFLPSHPWTGQRWTTTCRGMGQRIAYSGRVLGRDLIKVAGHEVVALHTRITLSFSGSQAGTNPTDYWVSTTNGLILRERETVDVAEGSGPLGAVRYREQLALAIDSTAPVR